MPHSNKHTKKDPSEPLSEHGRVTLELPVHFSRHHDMPQGTDEAPEPLDTFNILWHGREQSIQRVPCIRTGRPPIIKWKTQRRRMEWETQDVEKDQTSRDCPSLVKYKSSRISTDGRMSRGACVITNNKLCVSLMDEMYKMTPLSTLPLMDVTRGSVPGNVLTEERGRQGFPDSNAGGSKNEAAPGAPNQPITVQIKKHETEQQTEARMRSYAYFVQQDEEDPWVYACNMSNDRYARDRRNLEALWVNPRELVKVPDDRTSMRICENPGAVFLDHVLSKGNPEKKRKRIASGDHTATIQAAIQVKREAAIAAHVGKPHAPNATPDHDSLDRLRNIMEQALASHTVVSRERIFAILKTTHHSSRLSKMAAAYHDARSNGDQDKQAKIDDQLHRWIMESCGQSIRHIQLKQDGMERYIRMLEGDSVNDILKMTILEVIQTVDNRRDSAGVVKKQDIQTACEERKVRLTDTLYSKVMKEYCVSVKGGWSLKTGNEEADS